MEAEAVAIRCWNAYIEEHGKEPSTVADFQEWLSKSNYHRNISYSRSNNIYDEYNGEGVIADLTVSDPSDDAKEKGQNGKPNPRIAAIQTTGSHSPRNTNYYDKYKQNRGTAQNAVFSEASTTMTPPSPASYHPPAVPPAICMPPRVNKMNKFHISPRAKTPPATRTKTNGSFPKYPTKNRRASAIHQMFPRTVSVHPPHAQSNAVAPRNIRASSTPPPNHNHNRLNGDIQIKYNNGCHYNNTLKLHQGPNKTIQHQTDMNPKRKRNASLGIATANKVIRTVSVSPKMVPDIMPKTDLTLFLSDYGIKDLKSKLTEYQIELMHLKSLEPEDLNELCAYLQLSITEKIRFKYAVKDLQEKKLRPNGNKMNHPPFLVQSRSNSNEYESAAALLTNDKYGKGVQDNHVFNGQKVLHSMQSGNDAVRNNNTIQRYGPY